MAFKNLEQVFKSVWVEGSNALRVILSVPITIEPGDVQIGAVELKDGATDARAKVGAGTGLVAADVALAVKDPALGLTNDAAVITDVNGTLIAFMRGRVKQWANALGAGNAAAALRTTQASDSPLVAVTGATNGAAVITDADGTLQQYMRGLIVRWFNALGVGTAAAALRTTQASDSPLVAVTGATNGAAVVTDVDGTLQQYMRGFIKMMFNWTRNVGEVTAETQRVVIAATPAPTVVSGTDDVPAANVVICNTGNLAAGAYMVEATMGFSGVAAAGKHLLLEHMNADESAVLQTLALCPAGGAMGVAFARITVAQDESIRIKNGVIGLATELAQGCIRAYKIA